MIFMTKNIGPLLSGIIKKIGPFLRNTPFVHMRNKDGNLEARAVSDDGTFNLKVSGNGEFDFPSVGACFGNLQYLQQLLQMDEIRKNPDKIAITTRERNDREVVGAMRFTPNSRMDFTYMATDPFRASINKPKSFDGLRWPVSFLLDTQSQNEILNLVKLHGLNPSNGKDDIFDITFSDNTVTVDFGGNNSHTSTLVLEVDAESDTSNSVSLKMHSTQFTQCLMGVRDEDGLVECYMSDKAMMFNVETAQATYELVIVGRKMRDD